MATAAVLRKIWVLTIAMMGWVSCQALAVTGEENLTSAFVLNDMLPDAAIEEHPVAPIL